MLYQLSYASTGKPSKIITQAIKLQATFYWPQKHCQIATYSSIPSTSRALLYSYSHFLSIPFPYSGCFSVGAAGVSAGGSAGGLAN